MTEAFPDIIHLEPVLTNYAQERVDKVSMPICPGWSTRPTKHAQVSARSRPAQRTYLCSTCGDPQIAVRPYVTIVVDDLTDPHIVRSSPAVTGVTTYNVDRSANVALKNEDTGDDMYCKVSPPPPPSTSHVSLPCWPSPALGPRQLSRVSGEANTHPNGHGNIKATSWTHTLPARHAPKSETI